MKKKSKIDNFLSRIFGADKKRFEQVQIDREVIEEIINIARQSYPHEFVALLQGKISNHTLKIDGLIFVPGSTSEEGAVMQLFMMPLTSDAVGSVHSHPGYSAGPSQADLQFFAKKGFFHMIIAEPYTEESIRAYDSFGNLADYTVI
ncbi:MAG: Mov34/MPN/PAD-1 family protein [Methanobacteriaceae archaeon]